jgi:hypothetical protein
VHLNHEHIFEESSTKYLIRIRCIIFSIGPTSITLIFLLLAAIRKSITPHNVREKYHELYLLLGFVLLLVINNISWHILCLDTLSLYPQVTKMFLDYSLFFPTYMTAFMLPLLVYYFVPIVRRLSHIV